MEANKSEERNTVPLERLKFAYYVTGHGFGHATRVVEVARHLIAAGHDVHLATAAPDFVYTSEISSPNLYLRKVLLDCGAVQADALTVDRLASLEKYSRTAVVPRISILAAEVDWLKSIKADLVISDVVPVACRAAADAGIPVVCVTNFSWDFIYAEYVMEAGHLHRSIVWQIAEDYSHCLYLLRLPGYCPMPAFRDVIDVPLVVRRTHRNRQEVRKELGIGDDIKLLIFNFGGQEASWSLKEQSLPPSWICLVCAASPKQEFPRNFRRLSTDVYTPDLIAASDCMLGKIGYGTVSEALAYKIPFVFVRRDYFNEEPFLRNMLEYYHGGVEMIRRDLLTGHWIPYLDRALKLKPCYDEPINGGEVAARILQNTAIGKLHTSDKYSGARRLQDAIILGFQLQRIPGRDISIPEWYSHAENELGLRPMVPSKDRSGYNITCAKELDLDEFKILHGELHGFPDTVAFLKSLASLDFGFSSNEKTERRNVRERLAAAGLFNWEDVIYVARAPGRLDVMGGIADYSGSLVLQMPIREACHAAVQTSHPGKQRLWKHALARQHARGEGFRPVLQIVSFGSELSNRAPTFDMDLADFMDTDGPISYEKAHKYFAQDPSQKWAAYVAGTILVLIHELGVQFHDGISILISSGVPEGKGVSSSAALEVATMSAIAAAHGLNISPRDLALLCQKVENHVVGAPCGVMDQMTSACGESDKLLAMVCQPAEVKEQVNIPAHIRFWGIDSGIRHSIGGADYGSVRVGTFIGRKMIKSTASTLLSQSSATLQEYNSEVTSDELDDYDSALLEKEATLNYLSNLAPHRYESIYSKLLLKEMNGKTFMDNYGSHDDPVTTIDPQRTYAVKAPTIHPIYENFHVNAFAALLSAASTDEQLSALGELLYQSHYSYSKCGLGSDGTDRLVNLVQQMQHGKKNGCNDRKGTLFGAKITGGGSGGTVCVLGRNCIQRSEDIIEIQQQVTYLSYLKVLPLELENLAILKSKGHLMGILSIDVNLHDLFKGNSKMFPHVLHQESGYRTNIGQQLQIYNYLECPKLATKRCMIIIKR